MGWQGDLLRLLDPGPVLTPAMREALIPMLAALLLEAGAQGTEDVVTETADRERGDEQNRD